MPPLVQASLQRNGFIPSSSSSPSSSLLFLHLCPLRRRERRSRNSSRGIDPAPSRPFFTELRSSSSSSSSSSSPHSSVPSSLSSRTRIARASMEKQTQENQTARSGPLYLNALDRIQQILNVSSRWAVVATVAAVVVWRHDDDVYWAVIGGLFNAASSKFLKRVFNQQRPLTALGLKDDPGMPSSHAQSLGFFSLYASLGLIMWQGLHFLPCAASVSIILFGLYLAWLRISQGLHTPLQVIVGIGFGYSVAGLWITLWNHIVRDVVTSFAAFHYVLLSLFLVSSLCFAIFAIKEWNLGDA